MSTPVETPPPSPLALPASPLNGVPAAAESTPASPVIAPEPPAATPVVSVPAAAERLDRDARVLSRASAPLPAAAAGAGVSGNVQVRVTVSSAGRITAVRAISGPSLLRDAAEDAARRSTFEPAMRAGVPVAGEVTLDFTFGRPIRDIRNRRPGEA
ncbi:MAG: TonB family protein [Vicinamibacterales bacterium]